ncbi:MAG: hypothetical protein M1832_002174 [Thelocarpon impressellum]|nr:MAG: hypothetical protein M1832_002174 [Thelocarpon impressellum]
MSFAVQTPQRPLPGAFLATPAATRYQSGPPPPQPSFRPTAPSSLSRNAPQETAYAAQSQVAVAQSAQPAASMGPLERAARTINETLMQEMRYPELDGYVGQGISSDYDIPTSVAWAPFQKAKIFDIPDKVFEQYNQAQVSTMMGLFAEFNHAWITIDNALYLWDYTHPNPELFGFEDQPYNITAVKLIVPLPDVFVADISHVVVVATTSEMLMIGLAIRPGPGGSKTIGLYRTGMSLSTKGVDVAVIEGSPSSGRVFFSCVGGNDVYELTYQREEKWFQNRCGKINHTTKGLSSLAPNFSFAQRSQEHVIQMAVDDSRNILYTLSSASTIRTFQMKPQNGLELAVIQPLSVTFSNIAHMLSSTELLSPGMGIVSISPISSREAHKLHLMATTSTGCRLFLSATSSYGYMSSNASGKLSMQVQHVRFPPPEGAGRPPPQSSPGLPNKVGPYQGSAVDTHSKTLIRTRRAHRFPPGYFFCFVPKDAQGLADRVFVSSPDSGRIARPQDSAQQMMTRFQEHGIWLSVESHVEDVGVVSPPFGAASVPLGFGNELAIQFDKPVSEVAILTNTGIHTVRRRRLVDIFAAAVRQGGGGEGLEGDVKRFIRLYGRGETSATALAVACGQGLDVNPDSRVAKITDPDVLEFARKAFIEFGGKPVLNENFVVDQTIPPLDNVRPSPRHEGIALYVSRLVRSVWGSPIVRESSTPQGGLVVSPTVPLPKLQQIQGDLTKLQDFLTENRSFIDGLAGPESLSHVSTKQEEVALQAEHRALYSLTVLISDMIEGISFVLVLFDERVEEIVLSLPDGSRQQVRQLTFEGLFATGAGKELAKELVKAIVNRNIANGSNVDTVAEALRRRCGSFCSADDVVIFKAQEQLKKASEVGGTTEHGRRMLHESLRLFQQVAANLSMEHLQGAVEQYIAMEYYAGGIELCLRVANESDRGNRASAWIRDGRPPGDSREAAHATRARIYELIYLIILNVDEASRREPEMIDGNYTLTAKRKAEAYAVIENSDDEVFHYDLYDWYLSRGWDERLLAVRSSYAEKYLQDKAKSNAAHADLLWRYYAQGERYLEAARVQLQLATSDFPLSLEKRIEYLSKAKANASTHTPGMGRQARQVLLHEVSELLDVANIQADLLARLRVDPRLAADRRSEVIKHLDGKVLGLTELFNTYADQASYFDICLLIYQAADHRGAADIRATWQHLIEHTHQETLEGGQPLPFEAVAEQVRSLGNRLGLSESTFPIPSLLPMLEAYAYEHQRGVGPPSWVIDTFLAAQVPYDALLPVLEGMFYNDEPPFRGRNRRHIADEILYVSQRWFAEDVRSGGGSVLGGDANAAGVAHLLGVVGESPAGEAKRGEFRELRGRIEAFLR